MKIVPVIMCGGAGTRMWPLSRDTLPKQFIPLFGEASTFQRTAQRFVDETLFDELIVITSADYRFLVSDQLKQIGMKASIVLEPMRRDTAAAVAVATEIALRRSNDAVVAIMAADHVMPDVKDFIAICQRAAFVAASGRIVTLGIKPNNPATGYGYIRPGQNIAGSEAKMVDKFIEKPDATTAAKYLIDGYLWNSGNFIFHAATMQAEIARFEPGIIEAVRDSVEKAKRDLDFLILDADSFGKVTKISIDFAVMERTSKAVVVPASLAWSDVGGWTAVWELSDKDANGNSVVGSGYIVDGKDNYVRSESMVTALLGVDNLMVITTQDAILIAHRDKTDQVKHIVDRLKSEGKREATEHREVYRPWGKYHSVDIGGRHQVKRITVIPGGVLSLQKHFHRAEHWVVVKGTAEVTRDNEVIILRENESVYLPLGCVHRMANPGKIDLEIVEVQVGSYLGEDDIVRIEDVYNRE